MKELGQKIYDIRKKKGLSQQYVADKMGVNIKTVRDLELGKTTVLRAKTLGKVEKFINYYG